MSYDDTFYESIRLTTVRSAETVVPIVLLHVKAMGLRVDSVIDVGGGEGWWAHEFSACGVRRVMCLDGGYVNAPVVPFTKTDLEKPLGAQGYYDLAVCLEVGEHLSPTRARTLVWELCLMSPVVLFSAAIPDQGGENHVNEQWPDYWDALFHANGFIMSGYLRDLIWDDTSVASWYRQNLMLAVRQNRFDTMPPGFYTDVPPKNRIHPATGNPRLKEST